MSERLAQISQLQRLAETCRRKADLFHNQGHMEAAEASRKQARGLEGEAARLEAAGDADAGERIASLVGMFLCAAAVFGWCVALHPLVVTQ